jgi:hypothetical protein
MNMITYKSQTDSVNKIYCGLASGNLVVLEVDIEYFILLLHYLINRLFFKIYSKNEPKDVFEIKIAKSPINCLEIIKTNDIFNIWLSSANLIFILNEK